MIDDFLIVQKNIKVNRPWPLVNNLLPPKSILDGLQNIQQLNGR